MKIGESSPNHGYQTVPLISIQIPYPYPFSWMAFSKVIQNSISKVGEPWRFYYYSSKSLAPPFLFCRQPSGRPLMTSTASWSGETWPLPVMVAAALPGGKCRHGQPRPKSLLQITSINIISPARYICKFQSHFNMLKGQCQETFRLLFLNSSNRFFWL